MNKKFKIPLKIGIIAFIICVIGLLTGIIGKAVVKSFTTFDFSVDSVSQGSEYDTCIRYKYNNKAGNDLSNLIFTLTLQTEDKSNTFITNYYIPINSKSSGNGLFCIKTDANYTIVSSVEHNLNIKIFSSEDVDSYFNVFSSLTRIFLFPMIALFLMLSIIFIMRIRNNIEKVNITPSVEIKKNEIKFVRCPYCNTKNKSTSTKCSSCGGSL